MKVAVIGTGNVGVAIAADLSIKGHFVSLVKSSSHKSKAYELLKENNDRVYLKEEGKYRETYIANVTDNLETIKDADVIFVTIQSTYHEELYQKIGQYLNKDQAVVIICSYMSSMYLAKYCDELPMIAETTGPYLEGRVELEDKPGEVVFRVGCRLTNSPLSIFQWEKADECMFRIKQLYGGFNSCYSVIESGLLNPNMVLHTVGAIMSIPRIEFSDGNFCMYREAYSQKNGATIRLMFALDEEKKNVLKSLGYKPTDILEAGGFLNGMESFFDYSESSDRAISPTSIRSRYITEDVSQGLVLLESIAKKRKIACPITTALIDIASVALGEDFRKEGRTLEKLDIERFIKL